MLLKANFADNGAGSGSDTGFRFIGSEGTMTIGNGVTVSRRRPAGEPGYNIGTFPRVVQDAFLKDYRAKYPPREPELAPVSEQSHVPPTGYNEADDHFRNFFSAVRSRKPVVEDATFGLRAAAPALLSNLSYFDQRPYGWDPAGMTILR